MDTLHAVAAFDIKAALETRPAKLAAALMKRAGIAPTGKMSLAEVNAKLAASTSLSAEDKISLKISLERAGILAL
jgi:hypothetical protein